MSRFPPRLTPPSGPLKAANFAYWTLENAGRTLLESERIRVFGQVIRLLGGASEVAGGMAMAIFAPDPTMVSKVSGVVLILHGIDTMQAAFRSIQSGKHVDSITHHVGAMVGKEAGFGETGQQVMGMIFDVGIPIVASAAPSVSAMLTRLRTTPALSAPVDRIAQLRNARGAAVRSSIIAELRVTQQSCFVAGTPLLTPDGAKPIEQFRAGDQILARAEGSPDGPVEVKIVEQTFVRQSPIINLVVRGHEIRTTGEHPFYVEGKGWICAHEIELGDLLSSHDGQWVTVEAVTDLNEVVTVYNLRVSDYHTYFVGAPSWGFSVWAHNATNYDWFIHEGVYYLRNADGFVFRSPYQSVRALEEGMAAANQSIRRLANPPSFGDILTRTRGAPPAGMHDPHAHHILFKEGHGAAQQALVEEGQAILRRYNIDPIFGPENLVWAPNRVAGQHSAEALRNVVDALRRVENAGLTYADIVEALERLGQVAARRP